VDVGKVLNQRIIHGFINHNGISIAGHQHGWVAMSGVEEH